MSKPPTIADYDRALNHMMDENEDLRAELALVRKRLDALVAGFDERGSLGILQVMAADMTLPPEVRIRAASAAVPYERPKLSLTATTTTLPLYDLLEERRRKGKVIEHDPDSPAA